MRPLAYTVNTRGGGGVDCTDPRALLLHHHLHRSCSAASGNRWLLELLGCTNWIEERINGGYCSSSISLTNMARLHIHVILHSKKRHKATAFETQTKALHHAVFTQPARAVCYEHSSMACNMPADCHV